MFTPNPTHRMYCVTVEHPVLRGGGGGGGEGAGPWNSLIVMVDLFRSLDLLLCKPKGLQFGG